MSCIRGAQSQEKSPRFGHSGGPPVALLGLYSKHAVALLQVSQRPEIAVSVQEWVSSRQAHGRLVESTACREMQRVAQLRGVRHPLRGMLRPSHGQRHGASRESGEPAEINWD